MTAALRRGHEPPRARAPGRRAASDRDDRLDRRPHLRAHRPRRRLRRRRRRVLPRALGPEYGSLSQAPARPDGPGRGRRGRGSQGGPARLRAVEGAEGGRGHGLGRALGPRPAGLAHRVLGDGRGAPRRRLRGPRRRQRPRLPPPRERGGADRARARRRARPDLDAQRDAAARRARRWRSRVGNVALLHEVARPVGPRGAAHVLRAGHYRQPIAFDDDSMRAATARVARHPGAGAPARRRPVAGGHGRAQGARSSPRWRTTSTRRAALAALAAWVREANRRDRRRPATTWPRCSASSASRISLEAERRRAGAEEQELLERRAGARAPSATSPRPTACATSSPRAAGRCATAPAGPELVPAREPCSSSTAATPCTRRCGRGAAASTTSGRRPAPRRSRGCAARFSARRRGARARSGSRDHQGVVRRGRSLPLRGVGDAARRARAAARRPRRGPGPAEPRRDLPHRRGRGRDRPRAARAPCRADVTPAVCQGVGGRRRAPAHRQRAQPRRLRSARRKRRRMLGATAPRPRARRATTSRRLRGRGRARARRRGQGPAPARRVEPATSSVACRCGAHRIANVSAAAAVLLYGIVQGRDQQLDTGRKAPITSRFSGSTRA